MRPANETSQPLITVNDDAISLADIIVFIQDWWKTIVIAALVGGCIGIGSWFTLAGYKAETTLLNNGRAIDFLSWRTLQKSLPILASQLKSNEPKSDLWTGLDNASWWQKNVIANYSLSKADTKDLVGISKELQDNEGQSILSLSISTKGSTKDQSLTRLDAAIAFIREGSAYLLLKSQINGYEVKILNSDAELQKKITNAEVELKYLKGRALKLETLRQSFPANVAVNTQQVVDLKESSAKFMPINTQLVAVNTDINSTVESLQRMRNELSQNALLRDFLSQAKPLLEKETNGLILAESLLKIESDLRQKIDVNDINAQQLFNDVRASIVQVQSRFTKGLESGLKPVISRTSPLPATAGGLLGGAVLTILYALARKAFKSLKTRSVTTS